MLYFIANSGFYIFWRVLRDHDPDNWHTIPFEDYRRSIAFMNLTILGINRIMMIGRNFLSKKANMRIRVKSVKSEF